MKDFIHLIKNPAWIAASHLTENIKSIEKCCEYGAGGIVLKGTDGRLLQPCNRKCQKCKFPYSFKGRKLFVKRPIIYSFTPNSLLCEFLSIKELKFLLSFLKENYPNIFRVVNISGETPQKLIKTAKMLKKYGAQILELNTKYTIRYRDNNTVDYEEYLLSFIKKITKEINLPIIIKICSDYNLLNEGFLKNISKHINGLTITDGKFAILPSIFEKEISRNVGKKTCAVVGEPLWKSVKKYVPIAKHYVNFVSASGGIYNTERAKEIMKLGANSVQLCSGIEFFGHKLISDIAQEVKHLK